MDVKRVRPALIALVALGLLVSTVMAASPSPSPAASPGASPASSPRAKESPERNAAKSPKPSRTAETPEPADAETPGTPPTADQIAGVVAALKAAGITTTAAQVKQLTTKLGLGEAVRVLAFANASNKSTDAIVTMFQGGKGWGQIKKELGLSIGPGIGWIMGHGHGGGPKGSPKP